jgi:hypothetical protein
LTERIDERKVGRIGLTAYYTFIWILAVWRFIGFERGRDEATEMPYLTIAIFAGFAVMYWWFAWRILHRKSDRIAAVLCGLFYALRIAAPFTKGLSASVSAGIECVIISVGMVAVIIGLIRTRREAAAGRGAGAVLRGDA